jgi:hypothetical protein
LRAIAIAASPSLSLRVSNFYFSFMLFVIHKKDKIWIIRKQPRSLENIPLEKTLFVTKPYDMDFGFGS